MMSDVLRPQYLYRPSMIWRRVRQLVDRKPVPETCITRLPWGLDLEYRPNDHIGGFLYHHGIYDLEMTEAIWRLVEPGELALDVGANIGYVTGLMAKRVGPLGRVVAFEPHPELFGELQANRARWNDDACGTIELHAVALSNTDGSGNLVDGPRFAENRGTSAVVNDNDSVDEGTHSVELRRLDGMLPDGEVVGVMKLDVEGHERAVLQGAQLLLGARRVRDIVFEDHGVMPTPVASLLTEAGYTVLRLGHRWRGPAVSPPSDPDDGHLDGPPNYVATRDSTRVSKRLASGGWRSLRGSSR